MNFIFLYHLPIIWHTPSRYKNKRSLNLYLKNIYFVQFRSSLHFILKSIISSELYIYNNCSLNFSFRCQKNQFMSFKFIRIIDSIGESAKKPSRETPFYNFCWRKNYKMEFTFDFLGSCIVLFFYASSLVPVFFRSTSF